jgi:hypothetical protein
MGFIDRVSHAWNAFRRQDLNLPYTTPEAGMSSNYRPDRVILSLGNERSIVSSVYSRIAIDVSAIAIKHIRLDENNRYISTENSSLNECLTVEANKDQTGRALIHDTVISMFDEGVVAIVPVDTSIDPTVSNSYNILSLRVGKILEWYPSYIKVRLYNDNTGQHEDLMLPKKTVAIIENPLYAVMNQPNSTLKRLIYKLNLLDSIDEQSGSGKLDLIIQLPYAIKTAARQEQAEKRRKDIELQLSGSKYGIAYVDGTEKVTQLNRPAENNLMKQIEYLTSMLYSQLGITQSVFDGTADEKTMLNYYNRTVEPILTSITEEMLRKFLTKTARSQLQSIGYFREPFKLVPVNELADIADKFTRNEILSSNEVRSIIGYRPSSDPRADELRNKNLNVADQVSGSPSATEDSKNQKGDITNEV